MPPAVSLTFTDVVIEPIAVAVVAPDGTNVASGPLGLSDNTVVQALAPGDNPRGGAYSISYQVTAADGHPLSGELSFDLVVSEPEDRTTTTPPTTTPTTVDSERMGATAPASTTPSGTNESHPSTTSRGVSTPTSQDVGATAPDDEGVDPVVVGLVGGLGLASVGLATWGLKRMLNHEGDG